MRKKQSAKSPGRSPQKAEWTGFINVYLTATEKKKIKTNPLPDMALVEFMNNVTETGYKLSITYAEKGGFHTATLYGQWQGMANAGYAMSCRHSDMVIALTALEHCYETAGENGSWAERFTTAGDNDW